MTAVQSPVQIQLPHVNTYKLPMTLGELARLIGARLEGNPDILIRQLVPPQLAHQEESLVYAVEPEALRALDMLPFPIKAAVLTEGMGSPAIEGLLFVKRPKVALAQLIDIFHLPMAFQPGIHPSALVDPGAKVDPSASVGPFSYVGPGAVIGENTVVLPQVTVMAGARVGANCLLHPGVRLGERVVVGNRVIIHHNASIGADGFSFVTPDMGSIESAKASGGTIEAQNSDILRIHSVGTVILEDDVEVGACATIDRATLGATIVKRGTKVDNLVMIGHNNQVGENCLIVSQTGIAGSCKVGNRVVLAGQVGLSDHIKVGDDAIVMAKSGVMKDVPEKTIVGGTPAIPRRQILENLANVNRLGKLYKRIAELEERLVAVEGKPLNTM